MPMQRVFAHAARAPARASVYYARADLHILSKRVRVNPGLTLTFRGGVAG